MSTAFQSGEYAPPAVYRRRGEARRRLRFPATAARMSACWRLWMIHTAARRQARKLLIAMRI
jgi:hypothetical protein